MASVHRVETESGPRWRVKWRNRGEARQRSSNAHTAEAAKRIKLAAEAAHDIGRPYYGPEHEAAATLARRVDMREAARDYLKARKRAGIAASTIRQTDICVTLFFDVLAPDADPDAPLWSTDDTGGERLSTASLAAYYDHLRGPRNCSLGTSRSHVEHVERWWAWLGNSDAWADRVPRPRTIEMAAPTAAPEPVAPTWIEMDRAIACATGWYPHLMTVCRFTGLRGEDQALELRRDDLDHEARTLRIRPELGKTPAERRGRTVPVSRHLLAMIATWPDDPDGWLVHVPKFSDRWEGPPKRRVWNAQVSGAWRRAAVRPEVWDTQPTNDGRRRNGRPMHAFRRGVITGLQALGAALDDVKYLVGHKVEGGVTVERYTDPAMVRKLREVVDLIPPLSPVPVRAISGGGFRVA